MNEKPATPPVNLRPVLIDGKKVNAIKVEHAKFGTQERDFLIAITCDMAIYFSWSLLNIKWERAQYEKGSL